MKTKQMIAGVFALSASLLMAQTSSKPATVHIKTSKIVNGVETTTDTTYTGTDLPEMNVAGGNVTITETKDPKDGTVKKIITINDEKGPLQIVDEQGNMSIKSGSNEESLEGKTFIVKKGPRCNATPEELKNVEEMHITIIKRVDISDASAADLQMLGKPSGVSGNKLSVEQMNFYPNPNNGRFNLSFMLPDKGDTEVKVLDIKGQEVFSERLAGFTGNYSKEIDISKNPKGIYFVRVEQGKKALVKKIVVD